MLQSKNTETVNIEKDKKEVIGEYNEEQEKNQIIRKYRRLLNKAKPLLQEGDTKFIKRAFNMALEAHKNMRRKSGEPYIYHPLAVAQICVEEIGLGTTAIVAALLHDVVEDTEVELEDIEREFGEKVAKIIDGLTKISGVFEYGSSQQAENFRKMLLTLSDDMRVILIKLADRLHNMRTLDDMPRDKQLKIASETIYIYAPLAHRLGLYSIKTELEDLYLKYTSPDEYIEIVNKLRKTKPSRSRFINSFIAPIENEIKNLGYPYKIKSRPKSIYSIWKKMKTKDISFEEVYDLFAVRIILDAPLDKEKQACWQVYSIVTDFYQPNPDRLRDWISTPRANGYESLHTTVMSGKGQWVEVQIRTSRMDEIAEKGYAAHWKYKHTQSVKIADAGLEQWLSQVREAIEKSEGSALEFLDNFRPNLFQEEVFVFTPKGELRTLPHGSTVLDFAFEIHTDIGKQCIGGKVNQKLMPLSYELQNGDQIEVITSKKQKPSEDWLKMVVTSKARQKIKDSLKEGLKEVAAQGRDIVEQKLKTINKTLDEETLRKLLLYFEEKSQTEFFAKVARGQLNLENLEYFESYHKGKNKISSPEIPDKKAFEKAVSKIRGTNSDMLLIGEDMDKIDYTLATCCNPIPGDEVFGYVTANEGIKIHRTSCPNSPELMSHHGNRIIKAKWTSQHELAFLAGVKVMGTDKVGLINEITSIISNDLKVNIRSLSMESEDGIFEGNIVLYVKDTDHLKELINKLKNIEGVYKVTRFDS